MSEYGKGEFEEFRKIARLNRECVVTEKIDGTNAQIFIEETPDRTALLMRAGSRTRFLTPDNDNYGFAQWAEENALELSKLGPGRHFGEWWGNGIQRGYGLPNGDKRFSLFNTHKWAENPDRPACCGVVPILYQGPFDTAFIQGALTLLGARGSYVAPFMNPEGIVVYHMHANQYFKVTLENDEMPKSKVAK